MGLTARVVTLPANGVLIAATDLHGNLRDFHTVVDRFLTLTGTGSHPPHLVICGDPSTARR